MRGVKAELKGRTFGRLEVMESAGTRIRSNGKNYDCVWLCKCTCGEKIVASSDSLLSGHAKSCGCGQVHAARANIKHGEARRISKTPEYVAWQNMLKRCYSPGDSSYHNYGKRGIRVCSRWRKSFSVFLADVGRRPGPGGYAGYSLDRFPDNDGDYEPGNVRWATRKEQSNNTRKKKRG